MGYYPGTMPKKVMPSTEFGKRLYKLRLERGLTQIQLAEAIGSSQRCLSHYETVADYPPASIIIALAKVLQVSADELLGIRPVRRVSEDPEKRRLWKKFRQVLDLSEKDRRAIIRMINSLSVAHGDSSGPES